MSTVQLPPKAGDTILHRPSGETWVVAAYELASRSIMPCGWPLGYAKIDDCEVIERCSEAEHVELLKELAAMRHRENGGQDPRQYHALAQLVEMRVPGYVMPCPFCGEGRGAGRHGGEWCCAAIELHGTRAALGKVRAAIIDKAGLCVGLLPTFDQILEEAGIQCTDQ